MSDLTTRPYGRRFAGIAMAASGVLYAAANAFYWVMFPDEVSETAANVDVAAADLGAWRIETILFALTHLLLLPATAGLIVAVGARRRLFATVGAVFAVPGLYFSTVHLWHYNAFFGALAGGGVSVEAIRPVTGALDEDPFVMAGFAVWILGFMIGLLVLSFGAWRAGLVSLWVPLALTGGQVLDFVSNGTAPKLVVSALMAAGLIGLALGIGLRRAAGTADETQDEGEAAPASRA
ncbi:hypothetical protein [Planotetraspora kaengkrachanensis]|uniref:DUF4386 family protein n=1 Tax=Planotetraspora kaengkrachanensis TaxID=575193 RepID=A0A8J3PZE5_9ACTN|nr:hypothetical protein [Planotetraspora kaengkrachanensis]GIG83810.1 hypothetical protein Pka01_69370 [Planotetraspora kaengkrachanensis]